MEDTEHVQERRKAGDGVHKIAGVGTARPLEEALLSFSDFQKISEDT